MTSDRLDSLPVVLSTAIKHWCVKPCPHWRLYSFRFRRL